MDLGLLPLSPLVGTLLRHFRALLYMGASPWTLKVLRSGFRIVWGPQKAPLLASPRVFPPPFQQDAVQVWDQEVDMLVQKHAVSVVHNVSSPGFYCRLSLL